MSHTAFNTRHALRIMGRYIDSIDPETSTEVAEAYAIGEGCDHWLDDPTHPVWDAAVDAMEQTHADFWTAYENREYVS